MPTLNVQQGAWNADRTSLMDIPWSIFPLDLPLVDHSEVTLKRSITVLVVLGVALLVGYLILGSRSLVQAECEVCVEFRGQRQCRIGAGTTDAEARTAAQRAACAVMASGMDASIACQNTPPRTAQCPAPR
jgi:hypothetical protein